MVGRKLTEINGFSVTVLKVFYFFSVSLCLCILVLFLSACSELEETKPAAFYADSNPPLKQEFRWSNGNTPKSFDPALASAPPETDIVRAVYDGLTETDPNSLEAIPALAADWTSSDDFKTWTFYLRKDAKWTNGKQVTANDFVRSWKRLADMGNEVSHYELLKNIVGIQKAEKENLPKDSDTSTPPKNRTVEDAANQRLEIPSLSQVPNTKLNELSPPPPLPKPKADKEEAEKFGAEAIDKYTLKVSLIKPDKDFPKLAAHPVLRPVYGSGQEFEKDKLNPNIITNGAFRIMSVAKDGITLEKSEQYYNRDKVKLERVRFVPAKDADSALQAYRRGEVDAVTNAEFEPLALKLLIPFNDFKRTIHSALNFYEFNRKKPPFNDRRIREALAISIERKRLTEDDTKGATKPALTYLPFAEEKTEEGFSYDVERAKWLLEKSGYPDGENFPIIKLVINRNDLQQKIARSVAKMWKDNLNVDTVIIVKETEELEEFRKTDNFDLVRRGIVLPTADETANMLAIFAPKESSEIEKIIKKKEFKESENNKNEKNKPANQNSKTDLSFYENKLFSSNTSQNNISSSEKDEELLVNIGEDRLILTEEEAVYEVPAIPLFFHMSYSLVKPYVKGFAMNTLDAPLLKDVEIDNNWQPESKEGKS